MEEKRDEKVVEEEITTTTSCNNNQEEKKVVKDVNKEQDSTSIKLQPLFPNCKMVAQFWALFPKVKPFI